MNKLYLINGKDVTSYAAQYGWNFCLMNIAKYLVRAGKKENEPIKKEILKAIDYLNIWSFHFNEIHDSFKNIPNASFWSNVDIDPLFQHILCRLTLQGVTKDILKECIDKLEGYVCKLS